MSEVKRIGLLIPHTDTTSEFDFRRMFSVQEVSIHTQRMWLEEVSADAERRMIEDELPRAAVCLQPIKPHAAVFGCTSAGSVDGLKGDRKIAGLIEDKLNCPAITAFGAVIDCIEKIKPRALAVVTPYVNQLSTQIASGLSDCGFNVKESMGMGMLSDYEIGALRPEEIIQFVLNYLEKIGSVDALFISCTNLRAFECKEELEAETGLPIITSNSAIAEKLYSTGFKRCSA